MGLARTSWNRVSSLSKAIFRRDLRRRDPTSDQTAPDLNRSPTLPTRDTLELQKLAAEVVKAQSEALQVQAPWYKKPAIWAIMVPAIVSLLAVIVGFVSGAIQAKLDLIQVKAEQLASQQREYSSARARLDQKQLELSEQQRQHQAALAQYEKEKQELNTLTSEMKETIRVQPIHILVESLLAKPPSSIIQADLLFKDLRTIRVSDCTDSDVAAALRKFAGEAANKYSRFALMLASLYLDNDPDVEHEALSQVANIRKELGPSCLRLLSSHNDWRSSKSEKFAALAIAESLDDTSSDMKTYAAFALGIMYGKNTNGDSNDVCRALYVQQLIGTDRYWNTVKLLDRLAVSVNSGQTERMIYDLGELTVPSSVDERLYQIERLATICPPLGAARLRDYFALQLDDRVKQYKEIAGQPSSFGSSVRTRSLPSVSGTSARIANELDRFDDAFWSDHYQIVEGEYIIFPLAVIDFFKPRPVTDIPRRLPYATDAINGTDGVTTSSDLNGLASLSWVRQILIANGLSAESVGSKCQLSWESKAKFVSRWNDVSDSGVHRSTDLRIDEWRKDSDKYVRDISVALGSR